MARQAMTPFSNDSAKNANRLAFDVDESPSNLLKKVPWAKDVTRPSSSRTPRMHHCEYSIFTAT